jgi:hypothetical protein
VAEKNATLGNLSQHLHVTNVVEVERRHKKRVMTAAIAAVVVFAAFTGYLKFAGVPAALDGVLPNAYVDLIGAKKVAPTAPAGPTAEQIAEMERAAAQKRAAMPVKELVGEINPQALFNNKRTGYDSYLPLEKLSFQKTSLPQFLSFLNTAVPDDIGFSECVFQAPNYYYLRGVAMKASSQHTLMDRLKAVSKQFQSPIASEAATEVAAFGQFNVPQVRLDAVRGFVPTAEIGAEVKAFKSLATTNKVQLKGLEKPVVEDFGVFKRYAYNVSSTADFADLLNFLNTFANSPIRMGIPKAELKFAKKFLITNMRVEMFVLR